MHLSFSRIALFACALCLLLGCGSKKAKGPPVYPVTGVVRVNGQPASQVMVVLHSDTPIAGEPRPFAKTNADGTFAITTREPGDGALPGKYRISLTWSPTEEEESTMGRGDKLGGRFADPATSNLFVDVKAEPNIVPAIEL